MKKLDLYKSFLTINIVNQMKLKLKLKPNSKDVSKEPGMLAYCRPKNLKEMIGSNNILNNKVIRKTPTIKILNFVSHVTLETFFAVITLNLLTHSLVL